MVIYKIIASQIRYYSIDLHSDTWSNVINLWASKSVSFFFSLALITKSLSSKPYPQVMLVSKLLCMLVNWSPLITINAFLKNENQLKSRQNTFKKTTQFNILLVLSDIPFSILLRGFIINFVSQPFGKNSTVCIFFLIFHIANKLCKYSYYLHDNILPYKHTGKVSNQKSVRQSGMN